MTPELRRVHHLFLLLVALMVAAFLLWGWSARLDVVSTAPGRVIPSSRVKTVQHLEGGIVHDILVREGDRVTAGQPLVVLEKTDSAADVAGLRATEAALRTELARFQAEADGKATVAFPAGLEEAAPERTRESRSLFLARRQELESALFGLQQQIRQRQQDVETAGKRITTGQEALALAEKQLAISREMLRENLTTQYKHLSLEREVATIKGKLAEDRGALKRAGSMLKEARRNRVLKQQEFKAQAREKASRALAKLEELGIGLRRHEDSLQRTEVRSPVDGTVQSLHIVTRGGVVKPGMPIVDIVPSDDRLVIEALLPVAEIGYVHLGQQADIRLASPDSRRLGKIGGTVVHISPDALSSGTGEGSFYAFRVETTATAFTGGGRPYRLYPGMQVAVAIQVGSRSVLDYLLDPFLNSLTFTFQER